MSTSVSMELALVPRCTWAGESKPMQHPPDLHTSVAVTRSIPVGTCFGPCVLQGTFYDTIAFIAEKTSDNHNKTYVFKVDPEALRNSALLLSWLRLIKVARNAEEQNTEAFLRAEQLYIRTTRNVRPEEELLVWYDDELCHLLGFKEFRGPSHDFKCARCGQVFKYEHPFLAHCRFMCAQMTTGTRSLDYSKQLESHSISKRQHRVTDFHNIARDLEKNSNTQDVADVSQKKRKHEEPFDPKSRKSVLLEKTNISNDVNITTHEQLAMGDCSIDLKIRVNKSGCNQDEEERGLDKKKSSLETGESSNSSAFSLISSNRELKSAFCKPHKRISPLTCTPTAPSGGLEEMTDTVSTQRALVGYSLMASGVLNTDMRTSLSTAVTLNGSFPYAPEHWSRGMGVHLHSKSSPSQSSLTTLPPTFTSFGVSVQNWCAKCNLSFRMTSDLVFHMRSHHKKEFAAESQMRRRREEKLTCPICHEYFRERHHLSRHMTSHN